MSEYEPDVPDESEQLDQLQAGDSLVDRGVDDVLDEGYVTPDNWSVAQGFGNTPAEMRRGETIERGPPRRSPVRVPDTSPWNPEGESREVGSRRAGRLVDASGGDGGLDTESQSHRVFRRHRRGCRVRGRGGDARHRADDDDDEE